MSIERKELELVSLAKELFGENLHYISVIRDEFGDEKEINSVKRKPRMTTFTDKNKCPLLILDNSYLSQENVDLFDNLLTDLYYEVDEVEEIYGVYKEIMTQKKKNN